MAGSSQLPSASIKLNSTQPSRVVRILTHFARSFVLPTFLPLIPVRGAQVLLLTSPSLPSLPTLDLDTSRGKRTTQLSLLSPSSLLTLSSSLLPSTSVFLQSYRPSSLATKFPDHLSPEVLRAIQPNVILASLSAYGDEGEGGWGGKRGFDSLVQTASGFNFAEGELGGFGRAARRKGEKGRKREKRWNQERYPFKGWIMLLVNF